MIKLLTLGERLQGEKAIPASLSQFRRRSLVVQEQVGDTMHQKILTQLLLHAKYESLDPQDCSWHPLNLLISCQYHLQIVNSIGKKNLNVSCL